MKILLDECVNVRLRTLIVGHEVFTVRFLGWDSIRNGILLRTAADHGFECLITLDQGIPDQHNLSTLPLSVVVIETASNALDELSRRVPELLRCLSTIEPRKLVVLPRAG